MKVTVEYRDGVHALMVDGTGQLMPAGWRLQKGLSLPVTEFEFFDEAEAQVAAAKLQAYVDAWPAKRKVTR